MPKPLRIALDCSHYVIPGGIRTRIGNMLAALGSVAPENEYLLYYRGLSTSGDAPQLPPGIHAATVRARAPRRLLAFLENRFQWPPVEYWTGAIDVFHGTHFSLPAARSARLILTVHDVAYLRHPEFYGSKRWNDYGYRYLLGNSLRRADLVIAISQATRKDLIELCNVAPERIWVVPSGVDVRLAPVPEEQRLTVLKRLGIDRSYVLYPVGTIDLRKNLARTFRAYRSAFPESAGRPLLLLTGVGALPKDLKHLARDLDLTQDVRACHVGYPDDLTALLSGARWGMYLSLYEGFGLPPLEAMACGLPLVVSNVSSIPEVVGDAALLADPRSVEAMAAAMRRLAEDQNLRTALSARGRARAASPAFSWERAARQTTAAYRNDREAYLAEEQPVSAS